MPKGKKGRTKAEKRTSDGRDKLIFLALAVAIIAGMVIFYLVQQKGQGTASIPDVMTGEEDPKVAALMERLIRNPNDIVALKSLGNHYYDTGNFSMAEMFYTKVLEINPHDTNVIVDLGTTFFYTQREEEAIKLYQNALQIDPNHKNALFNMGVVMNAMGDTEGTLIWWRKFIEIAGDDPHVEPIRKMIAEMEGREKEGGETQ